MIRTLRRAVAATAFALLAGAAVTGCTYDRWQDPLPGKEARVLLTPGAPRVDVPWPVNFRRSAIYEVHNGTGQGIETILMEFIGDGNLREIDRILVEEPAGVPVEILPAPHGIFPLRARFGNPGRVWLPEGAILRYRVDILGSAGASTAEFTVPGVTPK